MHITTTRHFRLLTLLSVLVVVYVLANLVQFTRYTGHHPWLGPGKCHNLTDSEMSHLLDLTYKVHEILQRHNINHWLCFGSVFGASRFQSPLPWDDDVDIGVSGARLSEVGPSTLLDALGEAGLQVFSERWDICSLIQVYDGHSSLHVDLMAFYDYGGWMKRRGLETWLMYINYMKYHTFPTRLVEEPLPTVPFGDGQMPVPREGIEIQKYLYPHDWWKTVKPAGCR